MKVAETIRADVERLRIPHAAAPTGVITVSIGVATQRHGKYERVPDLATACDRALYEAKNRGRNSVATD